MALHGPHNALSVSWCSCFAEVGVPTMCLVVEAVIIGSLTFTA